MPISSSHGWNRELGMRCILVAAGIFSLAQPAWSSPLNLAGMFTDKIATIKDAVRDGDWETYVTGYAWHLPWGYQDTTRARLNETTWGGGFGRTLEDEDGDRHSVYLMAFADSHRQPQVNLGYAWQRY